MRTLTICLALLATVPMGMGNEAEEPLRRIELSVQEGPYAFGRDIRLTVTYRNDAEEPWVVPEDPEKSVSVRLNRVPPGPTEGPPGGYDMGRMQAGVRENITYIFIVPVDPITINPRRHHRFETPFERDWTGLVNPRRWTVWIVDHNVGIESNRLEIALTFTADSVAACLEIVRDKTNNRFKRKWHGEEYLKRFMLDLNLQWWRDWPNEPQPEEQERMEAAIQRELDRFEAFWKDPANAPAIEAAIERINREAGLLPEAQEEGDGEEPPGGGIHPDGHNEEDA